MSVWVLLLHPRCPQVLDCRNWEVEEMPEIRFFEGYEKGVVDARGLPRMLKVKDWPPDEDFKQRMVRHNQVGAVRGHVATVAKAAGA